MSTTGEASFLVGPRLYLRPFQDEDLDRLFIWHNDQNLYRSLLGNCWPTSRASVASWIERKSSYSTTELNLAICRRDTHEHVGNVYLRDIDWQSRRAEIHIFLASPNVRGQGFGQEAIALVCDHAFTSLGLGRIYLFVLAENAPAIHAYERVGFSKEGVLRRHAFKEGRECNVLVMGLLAEEFQRQALTTPTK